MLEYEIVIGLEVHVQLNTLSKAFCSDSASFGGRPNSHISAVSLAHPGTLPVFNKQQLESALKLGLALNCKINLVSYFDRKNYFYPDLPKGYQLTQDKTPVCENGELIINTKTGDKKIRLHHFHMEEDAGKSLHDRHETKSFIDLNRAGVPLLEIVTEPDFRNAEEVSIFMTEIRRLVRWLDISDGNMEAGSLRCDVNLSLRKPGEPLGTRCEMKNINSMKFARRAIEFEAKRQAELLDRSEKIVQQTRSFDPQTGTTAALRDKEDAHDYRYFPEPDLPPVVVRPDFLEQIRTQMPPLPWLLANEFETNLGLSKSDAAQLTQDLETARFFQKMVAQNAPPRAAANLVINKILPFLSIKEIDFQSFSLSVEKLAAFLSLIESGKLSHSTAMQKLWPALLEQPNLEPEKLAADLNLFQDSADDFLEKLVDEVLSAFPEKVAEFRKGKKGLLGFFTGEIMKRSRGKADPQAVGKLLGERLSG